MKIGHLWVAGSYIATSDLLLNVRATDTVTVRRLSNA